MNTNVSITLPDNFRVKDFLSFHRRDQQAVAEQVESGRLRKGILWDGQPACMTTEFNGDQVHALLEVDGTLTSADQQRFTGILRHMLGLTQSVDAFEQAHHDHPQLGWLIRQQSGLRVPQTFSPFEALTWAVTGQQITVKAAVALRRNLILAAGIRHSSGIACYPDAACLGRMHEDVLRQAGFSKFKTQTLLSLSHMANESQLPLDPQLGHASVDALMHRLLTVRGVGPWTVNYALLRGFAWLDGSLHGDAAVRRGVKMLLGVEADVTETQTQAWLAQFCPWRALVAAHLWALSSPDNGVGVAS
jgi:DNA-3-methyladenine glycosylase II